MNNSFKVAKWEIKRNMMNKSFLISLIMTPALFLLFFTIPMLFSNNQSDQTSVLVYDELGIWDEVAPFLDTETIDAVVAPPFENEEIMKANLEDSSSTAYIYITEEAFQNGEIPIYTSDDVSNMFVYEVQPLATLLQQLKLESIGLTDSQLEAVSRGVTLNAISVEEMTSEAGSTTELSGGNEETTDPFKRLIPGAFAGLILFSIVITGMMIFQSASQEKKEKVAEMVLSSVTPNELMQGKILGYFVLGLVQVMVWLAIALPVVQWRTEIPIFEYLFVPELIILVFIAVAGYLLFASIFVSMGATVEDMTATSNFQGIVMMLPFIPFILIGPILSDPSGIVAKVGSYIPFSAPGVLLIRLSTMEEWPWMDIIISLGILLISIWLLMKLAGKIFKTGILMYGKNATPKEIWKWIRQ